MKQTRHPADTATPARAHYAPRAASPVEPDDAFAVPGRRAHPVRHVRPQADVRSRRARAVRRRGGPTSTDGHSGIDPSLFIGMMSHELRSPVTTIVGYAHLLRRDGYRGLTDEQREQAITDIDEESNRLRVLIDNLMTLVQPANVESLRDQLEPTLVHRIADQVLARHRKRRPECRIKLHTPAWVPPARAVPGYVDQIVENFVTNAEKYSRPRAVIDVEVRPENHGVVLRVLDRGPGIDEAEARQLFTGFYRSARLLERAPGTGIGLAVCQRLAEAQGGYVWARPRDGGGSEFGVWLPTERSSEAYADGR